MPRPGRPRGVAALSLAFACGVALGGTVDVGGPWPWLTTGAVMIAGVLWKIRRYRQSVRGRVDVDVALALAVVPLGAAWMVIASQRAAENDLYRLALAEPTAVTLEGTVHTSPQRRDRPAGAMSRFDHRAPGSSFLFRAERLRPASDDESQDEDNAIDVRGTVYVIVDQPVEPYDVGDRLRVTGRLTPPAEPSNPGEFDFRAYARMMGQAGLLRVPGRAAVERIAAADRTVWTALQRRHDALRARATASLLADLPEHNQTARQALLTALLLGQRGPDLDDLGEAFRRIGLAHVLAISGLHLGILAGLVLCALRLVTTSDRLQAWLMIGVVTAFLLLVELRMPILRAGVMTIAACLAAGSNRRLSVGSLVAFSGVLLLLWRPGQLFGAGFQLSYGVVLGLIYLAPHVRHRWFGRPDVLVGSTSAMIGQWVRSALAVAVTAWLIATPIVAFHFGHVAPLGALLSVVAVPLVAVVLACGYLKMLLSAWLPSIALLLGVPLTLTADTLMNLVWTVDTVPLSTARIPPPGVLWTALALTWVVIWSVMPRTRRTRRVIWLSGAAVVGWMVLPGWGASQTPLRIDMLAVGEGSCYVIRSDDSTVLYEVGSYSSFAMGERVIVPALRELNIRRIDAIVISHAHIDHYSAALDVIEHYDVPRVIVTDHLLDRAQAEPEGPVGYFIGELTERMVAVETRQAGDVETFGRSTWTWLHPERSATYDLINDESSVIRIDAAGRRVLLTGDADERAMTELFERTEAAGQTLVADVAEVPHHGAAHELSRMFAQRVMPTVALQSCGRRRMEDDHWDHLREDGVMRYITARDGAAWVEIDDDGTITHGTHMPHATANNSRDRSSSAAGSDSSADH